MFDDLSGVELTRRLEQRGVDEDIVELLVRDRDDCEECRRLIREILDG